MPSTLQALKASLPGIELSIALEYTADPIGALLAGELDVALISEAPTPRSRRVGVKPLFLRRSRVRDVGVASSRIPRVTDTG
jgi:LysR family transcriptional regulator, regulator for metE and metH